MADGADAPHVPLAVSGGPAPGSARRFLAANFAAFLLDFVLTLALRQTIGLPLSVCASISFIMIGAGFYFVHEYWTFRREDSRASSRRLMKNLIVLGGAFIGRIGVIAILEAWRSPELALGAVYFLIGAGASFSINYLANRFWVFRSA